MNSDTYRPGLCLCYTEFFPLTHPSAGVGGGVGGRKSTALKGTRQTLHLEALVPAGSELILNSGTSPSLLPIRKADASRDTMILFGFLGLFV